MEKNANKIRMIISNNKGIFTDVARGVNRFDKSVNEVYNVLDYGNILNMMCEFVEGYVKYKKSDDKEFDGSVLKTSKRFYDAMFSNDFELKKKNRRVIELHEFRDMNRNFLEGTEKLTNLIDKIESDEDECYGELLTLVIMTQRQYEKIAKVHKSDCEIYLWLISKNSKFGVKKDISSTLMSHFKNPETPVMHPGKIK